MNPSLLGLALRWGLPRPMLPRERVVSYTTFSPLPLDPAKGGTWRRSVFCGTFRPFRVSFDPEDLRIEGNPFRMNPYGPTCYVAPCPGELGLSSPPAKGGGSDHLFCSGNTNSLLNNLSFLFNQLIKIRFLFLKRKSAFCTGKYFPVPRIHRKEAVLPNVSSISEVGTEGSNLGEAF